MTRPRGRTRKACAWGRVGGDSEAGTVLGRSAGPASPGPSRPWRELLFFLSERRSREGSHPPNDLPMVMPKVPFTLLVTDIAATATPY